jgi:hypothetical protein
MQVDAQSGTNAIANLSTYTNLPIRETIYVRVVNNTNWLQNSTYVFQILVTKPTATMLKKSTKIAIPKQIPMIGFPLP